ncbi:mechanosensitive ion channel [Oceanobacillus damuensis]|uniref:mechanosensitive ion channel n=1 Tax=Oceanobacillus damuensis TaxID=937928 RepID=UPI000830D9C6|nr:mechanosensitive ion channel [Oceanobacillus damuensis]
MNNFMDQYFSVSFMQGLQNFVIALLVLLVGWLIAKAIGSAVEKALKKTDWDDKLINRFRTSDKPVNSARIIGKVVYYILLLVVFILFFNVLNLNMIANPLSDLISTFLRFIPAVLGAALILLLAWIVASIAQWLIVEGSRKINLQNLFFKMKVAKTEEEIQRYTHTLGRIVFYLILLLFIPGVLDALNIKGVAEPFSGLLATILGFIPKLIAAAIIFAVGWFVAKIVKNIVTNLLQAAGSEKLIARLKLSKLFEGTSFAAFVGNIVFILILIPITIAALEQLELRGITDPAIDMLNTVMNMIPNILVAIALVLIGVWLGKLIGGFIEDYLQRLGFDRLSAKFNVSSTQAAANRMTPSAIAGYIVQILIVFFLTVQALNLVQLDFLVGIATAITAYIPHVLAAVLILGAAILLGNIVQKLLKNILDGPASNALAGFAKYAILVIAAFMALTQLGIAPSIVNAAFILILGGLALAFGLAFGLGGKDFASKYLRKFDNTIDETSFKQQEAKNTDLSDLMEDSEVNPTKHTEQSIDDIDPLNNIDDTDPLQDNDPEKP